VGRGGRLGRAVSGGVVDSLGPVSATGLAEDVAHGLSQGTDGDEIKRLVRDHCQVEAQWD
jgi:hypothetical protein